MSAENTSGFYTNRSKLLIITRSVCAAAILYGGGNAAIDFGAGLEARHLASEETSETYQTAYQDEQSAFDDAERQALIAVVGGAGLVFTRKRDA